MLKSLRNHKAGSTACRHQQRLSQPTRRNGGLLVWADAEKNKSLVMIIYISQLSLYKNDR